MRLNSEKVLHIRVSEELHKFLRIRAAELGMSVTDLVGQWLEREKQKREDKKS